MYSLAVLFLAYSMYLDQKIVFFPYNALHKVVLFRKYSKGEIQQLLHFPSQLIAFCLALSTVNIFFASWLPQGKQFCSITSLHHSVLPHHKSIVMGPSNYELKPLISMSQNESILLWFSQVFCHRNIQLTNTESISHMKDNRKNEVKTEVADHFFPLPFRNLAKHTSSNFEILHCFCMGDTNSQML